MIVEKNGDKMEENMINRISFKFGIRQEDIKKRAILVEYIENECVAFHRLMSQHYLVGELKLDENDMRDLLMFTFFNTMTEREKMVFLFSAFETEKQYRQLRKG